MNAIHTHPKSTHSVIESHNSLDAIAFSVLISFLYEYDDPPYPISSIRYSFIMENESKYLHFRLLYFFHLLESVAIT